MDGSEKFRDDWTHATDGHPNVGLRAFIINLIDAEIIRAYIKHGALRWGRHEAWAIIREELDEVWEVIKADGPPSELLDELIRVAAMCIRYLETEPQFNELIRSRSQEAFRDMLKRPEEFDEAGRGMLGGLDHDPRYESGTGGAS